MTHPQICLLPQMPRWSLSCLEPRFGILINLLLMEEIWPTSWGWQFIILFTGFLHPRWLDGFLPSTVAFQIQFSRLVRQSRMMLPVNVEGSTKRKFQVRPVYGRIFRQGIYKHLSTMPSRSPAHPIRILLKHRFFVIRWFQYSQFCWQKSHMNAL